MAPNVTAHFFAANDINGDVLHSIDDEDSFFRGLTLKLDRDGLGSVDLLLSRSINFAGFASGSFQPEVFVRFLVHAFSDTTYFPWGLSLSKRQQVVVHRDEKGAEVFRFGGPGPKSLLQRHALGIHSNMAGDWNVDLTNGVWRWTANASIGQILNRILNEDQARPAPSLPFLTTTFNASVDSEGVPWADLDVGADGLFTLPIGEDFLTILRDMDDLVELNSHINLGTVATPKFELYVAQGESRNDYTGSAVGASVCLLKEGLNIANDSLEAEGQSLRKVTHVIVAGADGKWTVAERPAFSDGDYVKYDRIDYTRTSSLYWLEKAGIRWLKRQDRGERELEIEILPGNDDATGLYFPAPDRLLWLDNLISVDSSADGTTHSELDIDPADDQLVTGIDMTLGPAGGSGDARFHSWDITAHLNRERPGIQQKAPSQASGTTAGGTCHCPPICDHATVPASEGVLDAAFRGGSPDGGDAIDWVGTNITGTDPGDGAHGSTKRYFKSGAPREWQKTRACNPGDIVTITGAVGCDSKGFLKFGFFTSAPGTDPPGVPPIGGAITLTPAQPNHEHAPEWTDWSSGPHVAPAGTQSYALGRITGVTFDEVEITINGSPGEDLLAGNEHGAARCDHTHHMISEDEPTEDDDSTLGLHVGTLWYVVDDAEAPTEILSVWLLTDATAGAAVWLELPTGGGGGSGGHDITEDGGSPFTSRGKLDFRHGLDVTDDAGSDSTRIAVDEGELTHNSLSGLTSGDPHTQYALDTDLTTHAGASDPHTGYVLESLGDAKGDLIGFSADNTPAKIAAGSEAQFPVARSAATPGISWETQYASLILAIDAGNAVISTGVKGDVRVPFACEIVGVTLLSSISGSIVVDIWKDTLANFPPTVADTITASAKPTLSSATNSEDTTLTGWTKTLAAGDCLRFNVDSATSVKRVMLALRVKKT